MKKTIEFAASESFRSILENFNVIQGGKGGKITLTFEWESCLVNEAESGVKPDDTAQAKQELSDSDKIQLAKLEKAIAVIENKIKARAKEIAKLANRPKISRVTLKGYASN
jgi:fructose-1,6-bisphosphatase